MTASILAYVSRTGSLRTQALLRAHGWRLLLNPLDSLSHNGLPYALENGAWITFVQHQRGERESPRPDLGAFERAVATVGAGADWIALPDMVAAGEESLALSLEWLARSRSHPVLAHKRLLLVVQDGQTPDQIAPHLSERVGLFVGGSTDWKLATLGQWGGLARSRGAWCHAGRVNSLRRIAAAIGASCTSFDGSGAARFPTRDVPLLDRARFQPDLFALSV